MKAVFSFSRSTIITSSKNQNDFTPIASPIWELIQASAEDYYHSSLGVSSAGGGDSTRATATAGDREY